ncbi:MAG: DUF2892 domain-containing protein [Chthonomonadetes bacterium]|nr:DUF2892 domain-containing protein [Chthonomonadetes bacterium]
MTKNMGIADRVIRLIIAVLLFALIGLGTVQGVLAWVMGILALILLGTSAVGYCGLYKALGISTLKQEGSSPDEKSVTT